MSAELIERMEKCTGPDREIDAAIVAHLNNASVKRYPPTDDFGPKNRWQFWSEDGKHFLGSEGKYPVPTYTASLDAAILLVERLLPGWVWNASSTGAAWVMSFKEGESDDFHTAKSEERPAIALLIALLRALSSPEGTK